MKYALNIFYLLAMLTWAAPALAQPTAMILTEDATAYQKVAGEIRSQLGSQVRSYDMRNTHQKDANIVAEINQQKPSLIIALGDKAAELASSQLSTYPILIGMVLELDQEPFKGPGIEGVGLQIPPQSVLTQLRLIVPGFKSIGILSSGKKFAGFRQSIQTSAQQFGIQALDIAAADKSEVITKLDQQISNIDALWLLPDPSILDSATFHNVVKKSESARKPLIVFSENFVRAGALFSVSPDYQATGQQLVLLAKKMLAKEKVQPEQPYLSKFHYPIGSYSVLNTNTARRIGLSLTQDQLGFMDRLVNGD